LAIGAGEAAWVRDPRCVAAVAAKLAIATDAAANQTQERRFVLERKNID
jgi:hypothetical protein